MDIGPSEVETFWSEFLRKLRRRGLRGVNPRIKSGDVVSDAHEGIKAAVAKLMNASDLAALPRPHHAQRPGPCGQEQPPRRLGLHGGRLRARQRRGRQGAVVRVADQLRPKLPKLASFMDEVEADVLAYMGFPADHWSKLHSTNGLEWLNGGTRPSPKKR